VWRTGVLGTIGGGTVVLDGVLQSAGMASFKGRLTAGDVESVRAYLIERANDAKNAPRSPR
jgi:hypothetical protein